jgi:uncharacterized RDD family membrane protein YckC
MIYASFWKRWLATFIDALIMVVPGLILGRLIPVIGGVLFGLFYKPIFESSSLSATPGKALVGLVVLTESGQRLNPKQAMSRYGLAFLSGLMLGIGYLMALFTAKRQTFHDMAVGTVVIYREAPEVNYLQVWWSQVKSVFGAVSDALPSASSETSQATREIESLFKLFQAGALTEEEYREKKAKILERF